MPYVTWKTPSTHEAKTPLGLIFGHLAHLQYYWERESQSATIDAIFPWDSPFNPLTALQGFLINLQKQAYKGNYQHVFNRAAWKGDEHYHKLMAWLDDVKSKAFAKVDEVKAYIETNLISPIKDKIENELKPKLDRLLSDMNSLKTNVDKALSDVSNMKTNISGFDGKIKAFGSKIDSFDTKLRDLNSKANSIESLIDDVNGKIAELNRRVKILEEKEWFKLPSIFKS